MPIFSVTYAYTDDTATRDEIRPAHRAWLHDQAQLRIGGPTDANGALLIFEGDSTAAIETLLDADPFAVHGLIATRTIVGWTPGSGSWLSHLT